MSQSSEGLRQKAHAQLGRFLHLIAVNIKLQWVRERGKDSLCLRGSFAVKVFSEGGCFMRITGNGKRSFYACILCFMCLT